MRNVGAGVLLGAVMLLTSWQTGLIASGADETVDADTAAIRELLEGTSGRREMWATVPELVILSSVMEYRATDMQNGYVATAETLTSAEIAVLTSDLSAALSVLTGGRVSAFASVRVESIAPGETARVLRRGQVVVGRFDGVKATTGTLGFGGRTARNGAITSAVVVLDRDFDRMSDQRRLLRTHELGHALGYNHVESRRSVMNPRVGPELTAFDRIAIERAFTDYPAPLNVPVAVQARARQN